MLSYSLIRFVLADVGPSLLAKKDVRCLCRGVGV
jgi:hypothetical protein